jgi:shikimate dehydrogenase
MNRGAVIGFPIGHSLSPQIFSFLSQSEHRTEFKYEAIEVKADQLSEFIKVAKSKFIGLNVTIPHKEKILEEIENQSPEVMALGAANCLHFKADSTGRILIFGHNTDVIGFTQSVVENKVNVGGKISLILGGGGAARAVAYSLASLHCDEIIFLSKTLSKIENIISEFKNLFPKVKFTIFDDENIQKKDLALVVNSTPLGMEGYPGNPESFFNPILSGAFSKGAVIFDLIYRPEETWLINSAKKQGLRTIGGLDMLIYQAFGTWEIWFEKLQNKASLRDSLGIELRRSLGKKNRVFITGFMGVGKSTIAKIVAENLSWTLIDVDKAIEQKTGRKISAIFAEDGENFFRTLESEVVKDACTRDCVIVALGGGALTVSENLKAIGQKGNLIYLSASSETLVKRLGNSSASRPILRHDKTITFSEHVGNLMDVRQAQYKKADFEIDTDKLDDEGVAREVLNLIRTEMK